MGFFSLVRSAFAISRAWYRGARLNPQRETIAVYRFSSVKPARLSHKQGQIELFYRPKTFWNGLQALALTAALVWALTNYVEILKSIL